MQLSKQTVSILKNFATINKGILFREGNEIKTISPQGHIIAEATVSEKFPKEFGIYDLGNLLSVISLFKDSPILEFKEKELIISGQDNKSKIKYRYTDPSMIVVHPNRKLITQDKIKVLLSQDELLWTLKTAAVLESSEIAIVKSAGSNSVFLNTIDLANDSKSTNSLELDDKSTLTDASFNVVFKTDNLKMIPEAYEIYIDPRGISRWESKVQKYWISLEKDATNVSEI